MPTIWLASRSPRRQELLAQIGVEFDVLRLREASGRTPDVLEVAHDGEPALHYLERIARTKANVGWQSMVARGLEPRPVLGADTEVVLDGEVFGKPADERTAKAMLARLSGRTHEVVTAVALRWQDDTHFAMSTSKVTLAPLTKSAIAAYVASGEPFDKAGGYGIQGRAAAFVTRLDGSYSGVMGLPLAETAALLAKAGFPVP
ncbi:MAG: septum formation inhibitor Maf [Betaproteobacteria bacterium]|nr:septum formation inhibitor Maf [Betaproteobacteria bacterium]